MVDILHRIGVESPSPERVYEALTTIDGLRGLVDRGHAARRAAAA